MQPVIRALRDGDDMERLTALVHSAYAAQLEKGLRYWGTHQTVQDTMKRFSLGHGLVAQVDGDYVGTITPRPPNPESPVALYRDEATWTISQFAVAPSFKGRGLGRALHDAAVGHARAKGAARMALDTAQPAAGLIAMYEAWGYRLCGECDWRPHTNYLSVLMVLDLPGA